MTNDCFYLFQKRMFIWRFYFNVFYNRVENIKKTISFFWSSGLIHFVFFSTTIFSPERKEEKLPAYRFLFSYNTIEITH
jgi:hypothetical protein